MKISRELRNEVRSPQGRHVASWGLTFRRRDHSLSSGATSCGDQSASLNPLHAVRESGAAELLRLLAATSDSAAGPSVSEPPTGCLPAVFAAYATCESTEVISLRPLAHNFWLKAKAYLYMLQVFRLRCGRCELLNSIAYVVHKFCTSSTSFPLGF